MGPLLLLVTSVAGLFFGADAARGSLTTQFRSLLGETGSKAVEAMLAGASSAQSGHLAAITRIILLLVAALGVVVQLKDAMNTIWNVEEPKQAGLWWYLRTYLVSFAGILGLGFLLAVSLVISAALAALSSWSGSAAAIGGVINFVASLAILTVLFAMLFKWFPDTEIAWAMCLRSSPELLPARATGCIIAVHFLAHGGHQNRDGCLELAIEAQGAARSRRHQCARRDRGIEVLITKTGDLPLEQCLRRLEASRHPVHSYIEKIRELFIQRLGLLRPPPAMAPNGPSSGPTEMLV